MNADVVVPFSYEGTELRTLTIDGDPWFAAVDACLILDIGNASAAVARLDSDEVTLISNEGGRPTNYVSESGLYSLILGSRKPEARAFKRWITHDVLPTIRRHGLYATASTVDAMLADPDTMIRVLTDLKAERARRAELEAQAEKDAPKVIFADAVSVSDTTILVGELAKILRGNGVPIGQNRLFARLREDGYLIAREGSDRNAPTQRAMELGLFKVKETAITHSDGHVTVQKTTKVTGKGQQYFIRRFLAENAAA